MKLLALASIAALAAVHSASAQTADLRAKTATGDDYVRAGEQSRRTYALWAAGMSLADSTLLQRVARADKIQACLRDEIGVDNPSAAPAAAIDRRRATLFDITYDCLDKIEPAKTDATTSGDGDFGIGATGDQYMKARRERQLEHVFAVAALYDMNAPRARTVAIATFLDDCLKRAMVPGPGVSRADAADLRGRKLGVLTETCLVLWERR